VPTIARDRIDAPEEPRAATDACDENGVDRTLVRACLRDTALERLEALEAVYLLRESIRLVREPLPRRVQKTR
jgi:hypothetical protein